MNPNKTRMETLLAGGTPDVPPTWELGFQIEKTFFGMDPDAVRNAAYPGDEARTRAWWQYRAGVFERLVDDEERHYDQYDNELNNLKRFGDRYLALQSIEMSKNLASETPAE